MRSIAALLDRILPEDALHARFVNSLSRMEYVGARKMLKSRRAEKLDGEGIRHAIEELGHALRLKRAAAQLAPEAGAVATYSDAHTLAGEEAEAYIQAVDHAAEEALADLPEDLRAEANYLLSSAAIEVRAEAFYPVYEERLRAHAAPFSVAAIQKDEERHLAEMGAALARQLPDWEARLERVLAAEPAALDAWLKALESAVDRACGEAEKTGVASGRAL